MTFIYRYLEDEIKDALEFMRVVAIVGARQVGKSTLAKNIAGDKMTYVTLDDTGKLQAALSDPIGFIKNLKRPTIIDEIQRAPELIKAIKVEVDNSNHPGQFLLTGSTNILNLPTLADSLAGRMIVRELHPLAQFELSYSSKLATSSTFLSSAFSHNPSFKYQPLSQEKLIDLVLCGGYPEALSLSETRRITWHNAYLKSIIERDIKEVVQINKTSELAKLTRIIASLSSQEINLASISRQLQLDQKSIAKYIASLEKIYLIKQIPCWHRNELKRVVKKSKVHFLDSGLLASIRRINKTKIAKNRELLGSLLETFVFCELLKISHNTTIDGIKETYNIHHYRDTRKNEVDFVVENADGQAIGIEVKATQTASDKHFANLIKLAKYTELKAGIVIYTGEDFLSFGKSLYAVPISALFE